MDLNRRDLLKTLWGASVATVVPFSGPENRTLVREVPSPHPYRYYEIDSDYIRSRGLIPELGGLLPNPLENFKSRKWPSSALYGDRRRCVVQRMDAKKGVHLSDLAHEAVDLAHLADLKYLSTYVICRPYVSVTFEACEGFYMSGSA